MTTHPEQVDAAGRERTASGPYFQSEERSQVPHPGHGNADILARTAKARQSEQGALKQGGIDLLIMPSKLKGRLPLWRACSVDWLRGLVKPRNPKALIHSNGGSQQYSS